MADLRGSIDDIGDAIEAMLGRTGHGRLRDQIRGTLELYQLTLQHEALSKSSNDLEEIIGLQTGRLLELSRSSGRRWSWGAWLVAWMLAAVCGYVVYVLEPHWGDWWAVLLTVPVGLVGALLVVAGIGVLVQRRHLLA